MIPIPIRDENPTYRTPVLTIGLIVLNLAVWIWQLAHGVDQSALRFGAVPSLLWHHTTSGVLQLPTAHGDIARVAVEQAVPWPLTLLTSMFMHGGWLHVIGNMWFLWIFGDNLEDRMGPVRFLVFYLLCGLAAAAAQVLAGPSVAVPMVGASGAIAGVMGGYLLLYPRARVRCLWILIIFITTVYLPAWLLLGVWFLSQFLVPEDSGVAWMAHVGGFVAGLLLVKLFVKSQAAVPPPRSRFAV